MDFATWLQENVKSCCVLQEDKWTGQTICLEEKDGNVEMEVEIDEVPRTAAIVRFDKGQRRQILKTGDNYEFGKRCDYIILYESDTEYIVFFCRTQEDDG